MDFMSADEAKLAGVDDPAVLALAAREDRNVVTSDLKTMPASLRRFSCGVWPLPGVFLVKQSTPLAAVIEDLIMVWAASDADEWRDRIIEIPQS